jgi:hypothetical protein
MASLRSHFPGLDGLFTFTHSGKWPVCVHTGRHYYWDPKKATYDKKITFSGNFATPNLPKRFHRNFLIEI